MCLRCVAISLGFKVRFKFKKSVLGYFRMKFVSVGVEECVNVFLYVKNVFVDEGECVRVLECV